MPAHVDVAAPRNSPTSPQVVEDELSPFDKLHYKEMIAARAETIREVLARIRAVMPLTTALDAGAGVGFFSQTMQECGLRVRGFDGRKENVIEARKRFPSVPFEQADIQDRTILNLGKFDFVLCFGLLYHLENPFLAMRNLRGLTRRCLLVESMCIPDAKPAMLLRAEPNEKDQSLSDVACYPSEGCLVNMLYRAGFAFVYRLSVLPDHDDFRETPVHHRKRTVLLAANESIDLFGFRLCMEVQENRDPWTKPRIRRPLFSGMRRFVASPAREQYIKAASRLRRVFPQIGIPWRLPFGAWWLAKGSELDEKLVHEGFESTEQNFVAKLLRPGMTVLDVGAHHGLYTLLSSKCVGRRGQVIAFEASPRESRRLARHVLINRCRNVRIQSCAAGNERGTADFFVVDGICDWGNSLRAPLVSESTHKERVEMRTIDDVLLELGIFKVDFIKLDVEGAELAVLRGATRLLQGPSRPAILAEVQDLRTHPWGYAARDIVEFLSRMNYRWFSIGADCSLQPVAADLEFYDANLVALPSERMREFRNILERTRGSSSSSSSSSASPSSWFSSQRLTSHRRRGIEILKSMVRVRQS